MRFSAARAGGRRSPRIRTLVLVVNAFLLIVPLIGIVVLRFLEAQLVRQTEQQLIAEAVLVAEAWREAWLEEMGIAKDAAPRIQPASAGDERFFPVEPVIELANGLLPPTGRAARTVTDRDGPVWRAGARVQPILERAKLVNLSGARVLDPTGCVVASSGEGVGDCMDDLPEVRTALAGRYAGVARERLTDDPPPPMESISRRGRIRVYTALPVLADGKVIGVVRMARTSLDPMKALWLDRTTLTLVAIFYLVLVAAVTVLLSRAIVRPVREITEAAEAIASGEPRKDLEPHGLVPAEVLTLSRALDRMTGQLSDRAQVIADFAATSSHELKTPITAIRGAVELLQSGEMTEEQRARFLANIDADAERMDRLVRRLLELARIQSAPEAAVPVEVRPFLEALAARHAGKVRLFLEPGTPAFLTIPPDHLDAAVRNLVDNAVRHGAGQPVELAASGERGKLCVRVTDHGPGISDGNRTRLFTRFFTTERDRGGTGLGLSIVKAVAEIRGGTVSCESRPGRTTFTLVL